MRAKRKKQRLRKSTKYIFIIVAVALIILPLINLLNTANNKETSTVKTKQIYTYTNKFNYNYNVNLLQNKYIDEVENNNSDIAYVTDLINNIDLNLNYNYTASKQESLEYEYEIIGKMQSVYTKDGEEQKIMDKEETLVEKTVKSEKTDEIDIQENLTLDLKDKNKMLSEFKQQMGMLITSKYTVILKINVKTNVEGKEVEESFSPTVEMDLGDKTTKISGENNKEDTKYIAKEETQTTTNSSIMKVIDIVAIICGLLLLKYTLTAKTTNRIKNEYKQELNRLLKLCQDKIVQVNTKPGTNAEDVVYVKDFGEIVKLSEELFKPILYYINQEDDQAWFSVMSNNVIYQYVLKK